MTGDDAAGLRTNLPTANGLPRGTAADDRAGFVGGLRKILRGLIPLPNGSNARHALEELIEDKGPGEVVIDSHERTLIRNILGLRDIDASEVMVPRADIIAVEVTTPIPDLVRQMIEVAHSRIPIYRETLDDVIGMVHIKDVLAEVNKAEPAALSDLLRDVLFVSPTIRALDLLHQMRLARHHLALVVDEFGGTDGLITIEDLVEGIVGEITDEHDIEEQPKIVLEDECTAVANARATVEELEAASNVSLSRQDREEPDTIAGFIFNIAGRIAERGETIRHEESGLEFEIIEADPRRLGSVRVRWPRPSGIDHVR